MSAKPVVSHHEASHGSVRSYTAGFGLSITLTLLAYVFASRQVATGWGLIYLLAVLAIIQLFVQLVFFLHLGRESKPRWNLTVFSFALMVVIIVVFGSLWIMKNLSYDHHTLSPQQASQYLVKDEGY
jgi:cytochrome o ubiquinol oxidase operon protein cyoD